MATIEDDSPPSFESLTTDYLSAVTDEYEKEPWENHSIRMGPIIPPMVTQKSPAKSVTLG